MPQHRQAWNVGRHFKRHYKLIEKLYRNYLIAILILLTTGSCNPFSKSWESIYQDQQKLFADNRQTFENAVSGISNLNLTDTTVKLSDKLIALPDTLKTKLKNLGINEIYYSKTSCSINEIRFIPDSLWDFDRFSICEIQFNKCDERSKKGFHWTLEGSEHKHSFGQGNGWLIYTDSDRDPF